MSNGMPSWDEWRDLSQDQRDYSLYKVLSDLYNKEHIRDEYCKLRKEALDLELLKLKDDTEKELERLNSRKWFNRTLSAVIGAITGILAGLGFRIG